MVTDIGHTLQHTNLWIVKLYFAGDKLETIVDTVASG